MTPQAGGVIEPDFVRPDAPPDALPQHVRGVYQPFEHAATQSHTTNSATARRRRRRDAPPAAHASIEA